MRTAVQELIRMRSELPVDKISKSNPKEYNVAVQV